MNHAQTILEIAGMVCIAYGAFILASWLGWIVGGVALILISLSMGGSR